MNEMDPEQLLKRLQALEAEVARLRGVGEGSGSMPPASVPPPLPPALPTPSPVMTSAMERARTLLTLENLLSKAGIVVLILGMLLLFKYSIDEGWFTPTVRICIGMGAALALVTAGWRLLAPRPVLGQALFGGGMAVFYGTVCAAVQLYDLFSATTGLILVLGATVVGFTVALRRNAQVPAVIALAGGLAAPFLLDTGGSLAVVPVVVYSLLILAAGAVAYQRNGWNVLFWTALGLAALIFFALEPHISTVRPARMADQFALQMAWLSWWAAFALLPAQRVRRREDDRAASSTLHVATFVVPALAVGGSIATWGLDKAESGWLALAAAVLYAVGSRALEGRPAHQRSHRLAAALLGATGLLMLFDGDAAFFVSVALVVGLAEAARRTKELLLALGMHVAALVMAAWWLVRMADASMPPPLFRLDAVVLLAGVGALFWVWRTMAGQTARWVYWAAAIPFLMAWIAREAAATREAMAWTSVGWGVLALGLLTVSVVRWNAILRYTGLAVLAVVLGKLLLVDMASVAALWRILLFIGMGGLFLLASYVLPKLAPPVPSEHNTTPPKAPGSPEPPPLPPQ
jgi:uncharacterized membrane protein